MYDLAWFRAVMEGLLFLKYFEISLTSLEDFIGIEGSNLSILTGLLAEVSCFLPGFSRLT